MDTSTVRLVIFVSMFLIFAGDYSALISLIFGNATKQNVTNTDKEPKAQLKELHDKIDVFSEKDVVGLLPTKMMKMIESACLPKLICELSSSVRRDHLSEGEQSFLNVIRDTSLSRMAEVRSKYHFAAHMGQLISGIEGQGCHNFYPTCPLPRTSVLNMMKTIRAS